MELGDSFFVKFKKILSKNIELRDKFIYFCTKIYKISISEQDIVVKDGVVKIQSNQNLKNKLFTIKKDLLKELQKQGVAIKDIHF